MKLFFETYTYEIADVCRKLGISQEDLLDCFSESHRYVYGSEITFSCVGYFYAPLLKDSVFIMPKVFLNEVKGETRVFSNGTSMGYLPQEIINVSFGKDCILSKEDCAFIMSVSVWIYQSIKRYADLKPKQEDVILEDLQRVVTTPGSSSETLLDTIVTLIRFYHDHRSLFTFIAINKQGGTSKVSWRKTISSQTAIIQKGIPVYTTFINKRKTINFEEDVIVVFLSVMRYLQNTYYFGSIDQSGYELLRKQEIQRLIDSGKGVRLMRNMTHKYFVDDLVQLCKLLRLFFEQAYEVSTKHHRPEMTVVKKYENVFENMVDTLIGDDLPKALRHLKNQRDGKTIDHIYHDSSLIHNSSEMNIYYIGDSKYYRETTKLGTNSVAKQFTYAKNVIQYCINIFNKGVDENFRAEEKMILENFSYRDELTEGYNITPNFFIHGRVTPEQFKDKSKAFSELGLNLDRASNANQELNYHFKNRLFDRDTLILQTYDINFLYVLSNYVSKRENASVKRFIRGKFKENIIHFINDHYKLYRFIELFEKDTIIRFLDENFRNVIGKVYSFPTNNNEYCLMLALQNNEVDDSLVISSDNRLNIKGKVFKVSPMKLGEDAPEVFKWFVSGSIDNNLMYETYLPLFDIKAACGVFDHQSAMGLLGWINISDCFGLNHKDYFVVQAMGHSMEPKIQDGSYCVFQKYGLDGFIGTREHQIVLVEKYDSEQKAQYVIKEYHHIGKGTDDEKIVLKSLNRDYEDIILTDMGDLNESLSVKGVFVKTIDGCPNLF